jgi:hypothetical protein
VVSVTQPLNTTGSLGRLTLNILLSFAEFERQMIADRTRDKMGAARRKGKWVGGSPPLGYDIAATGGKLVVNPEEADRVKSIFALYLQHQSVAGTLAEMQARQWTTKRWRTRDGKEHLGRPFTKVILRRLLKNVLYVGKVSHQDVIYTGEQAPIIEDSVWKRVNEKLAQERGVASIARRRSAAIAAPGEPVQRISRLLALARRYEELGRAWSSFVYAGLKSFLQRSSGSISPSLTCVSIAEIVAVTTVMTCSRSALVSSISLPESSLPLR